MSSILVAGAPIDVEIEANEVVSRLTVLGYEKRQINKLGRQFL